MSSPLRLVFIILLAALIGTWTTASLVAEKEAKGTKPPAARVYGRIQFVDSFPDFKVRQVNSFPDLRVKKVTSFPDGPGKWQIVDSFPDYRIQMVDSFPDFTIEFVDSFPGVRK